MYCYRRKRQIATCVRFDTEEMFSAVLNGNTHRQVLVQYLENRDTKGMDIWLLGLGAGLITNPTVYHGQFRRRVQANKLSGFFRSRSGFF